MGLLENIVLSVLMLGNTHYVDVGQKTDAVIYYPSATQAHMTLPGQDPWTGALTMLEDGYHVAWKNGPEGNWQIRHAQGVFTYVGPDGNDAGTITKIVPGNPEGY
ncbi:hypothetical protein [Sulfitobacter aestuariivivens]|uniref:Uncharacterized protein n=1 Tax=Sulfitobacter aestuariivivens TaxID=2766981 RepID=A0A927D4M1_9RHOB|nr:hypothetical protein [Sulfitobacter aestuariivivens]MBD3664266.1 hypothetical protein [Sulfitobacter aestuariivivens]